MPLLLLPLCSFVERRKEDERVGIDLRAVSSQAARSNEPASRLLSSLCEGGMGARYGVPRLSRARPGRFSRGQKSPGAHGPSRKAPLDFSSRGQEEGKDLAIVTIVIDVKAGCLGGGMPGESRCLMTARRWCVGVRVLRTSPREKAHKAVSRRRPRPTMMMVQKQAGKAGERCRCSRRGKRGQAAPCPERLREGKGREQRKQREERDFLSGTQPQTDAIIKVRRKRVMGRSVWLHSEVKQVPRTDFL